MTNDKDQIASNEQRARTRIPNTILQSGLPAAVFGPHYHGHETRTVSETGLGQQTPQLRHDIKGSSGKFSWPLGAEVLPDGYT